MIAFVLSSHLQDLALIRGLKGRIAEMEARVGRYERRAEKRRQLATSIMEQAEIRKISKSDFTASLRRGSPALLIVDEVRIPVEFWKPQPAKLDRQKLLALLKTGQDVPGAALGKAGCSLVGENKMMCFTHTQLAALSSKLSPKDVKSRRDGNGQTGVAPVKPDTWRWMSELG